MSDPNQASTALQKNAPSQLERLSLPTSPYPGFALPEAVLHSIPLPTEFDKLVLLAIKENKVETILPSFFNPLFRRQNLVNKHTTQALESVGLSLAHLAREIEGRDRVLEQLTVHLNAYGEHVHQSQVALVRFAGQLAEQLGEKAEKLNSRLEREAHETRLRTDTLVALARSTEKRLTEQQASDCALNRRIEEITRTTENHASGLRDQAVQLAEARQQTGVLQASAQTAEALRAEQLAAHSLLDRRLAELTVTVDRRDLQLRERILQLTEEGRIANDEILAARRQITELKSVTQATAFRFKEAHEAIRQRIDEITSASEERANLLSAQIAQLTQADQLINNQFADIRQETTALHAESKSTEARLTNQLSSTANINQQIADLKTAAAEGESQRQQQTDLWVEADRQTQKNLAEIHLQTSAIQSAFQPACDQLEKRLETKLAETQDTLRREQSDRLAELLSGIEARLIRIEAQHAEQIQSASQREALIAAVRAHGLGHKKTTQDIDELRTELGTLATVGLAFSKKQETTEALLNGTKAAVDTLLPSLKAHLETLAKTTVKATRQAAATGALANISTAQQVESDGLYVALEARFRGPAALIRERQSKYLPIIEAARLRVSLFPPPQQNPSPDNSLVPETGVLDLGCGRGEWLDLLTEQGIPNIGIDQNRFFLDSCRARGSKVIDSDILEFLRTTPDESVAVVTSFHVIEHLPTPLFQEMTRHIIRILRRGGTVILETPNPGNVLTSSLNFFLDPTHLRPVHPEFARLILETSGFSPVQLDFMSPYSDTYKVGNPADPLAQRFNEYFYGPQDYAVIGIKP